MKIKVLVGHHGCVGDIPLEHRPGYSFTFDCACEDYDWLVVYEDIPDKHIGTLADGCEPLRCPREQTIFCTWEPISIKGYSRRFTRQFGHLLTNRPPEAEAHPHYHLGRGYFFWFNDRNHLENSTVVIPPKTKIVSVVCSSKQMRHTRHHDRFVLIESFRESVPCFDWFGRGVRSFEKKYEVLDPYKYHVVVENHIAPHHWTEKLADAFLCECLPFYAGDPAIFDVFPGESLIPIPIDDPKRAACIINEAIANDEYEKRRGAVLEAKRLILEKYNFWDQVISVIESSADQEVTQVDPGNPVRLYSRHGLRRHDPMAAFEDLLLHLKRGFR